MRPSDRETFADADYFLRNSRSRNSIILVENTDKILYIQPTYIEVYSLNLEAGESGKAKSMPIIARCRRMLFEDFVSIDPRQADDRRSKVVRGSKLGRNWQLKIVKHMYQISARIDRVDGRKLLMMSYVQ